MRILNREQMREADRRTIEEVGIPSIVLMENAGRQVVSAMDAAFDDLASRRIAVLAGRGNNGGDGFVVARTLLEREIDVAVYLIGEAAGVKGDARVNLEILRNLGLDVIEIADASAWELHGTDVLGADLIVDGLVGTGLTEPVTGLLETIIADVNAAPRPVVSIDVPSGIIADRWDVAGPAIDAALTVTLGAPKLPLVLPPAEALAGHLVIGDIGIPRAVIEELPGPWVELLTKEKMRSLVEPRSPDSHKGDFGRVVIVGGSRGRTGAPSLAAMGALRSGAGLVTVATPSSCLPLVAALGAEYMTEPLEETAEGLVAFEAVDHVLAMGADVIAIGPGLGRSTSTTAFVHGLVERAGVPLIIDADGVNAFAGDAERLIARDGVEIVITPHPGEMARLSGQSIEAVQTNRLDIARDIATKHRVHVVLKGHRTVIATPDGKTYINLTGNPGMATAGTGDVLTGVIAAWTAQLLDADAAAQLGVYLHGLAGDLAEADEGEVAMIAGDLIGRLGDAVLELTAKRRAQQAPAKS